MSILTASATRVAAAWSVIGRPVSGYPGTGGVVVNGSTQAVVSELDPPPPQAASIDTKMVATDKRTRVRCDFNMSDLLENSDAVSQRRTSKPHSRPTSWCNSGIPR